MSAVQKQIVRNSLFVMSVPLTACKPDQHSGRNALLKIGQIEKIAKSRHLRMRNIPAKYAFGELLRLSMPTLGSLSCRMKRVESKYSRPTPSKACQLGIGLKSRAVRKRVLEPTRFPVPPCAIWEYRYSQSLWLFTAKELQANTFDSKRVTRRGPYRRRY